MDTALELRIPLEAEGVVHLVERKPHSTWSGSSFLHRIAPPAPSRVQVKILTYTGSDE